MNNHPPSYSKTSFWRIVASFLCCLRKKSPQIHLPPNTQNPEDLEAQISKENHVSLEISLKNPREPPQNPDQSISSPQPPLENNNSQTISLPLSNLQKQAQNNSLENRKNEANIQETTQDNAINPLNSQQKICKIPHPNQLPSTIALPKNRKKITRPQAFVSKESPLQVTARDISIQLPSENTSFYTAHQENMNDQPTTQDLGPNPEPPQEKENIHPSAEADILQRRPKPHELMDISKVSTKSGLNKRGFNNPSANYCFAHALLQILYGLPEFREKTKRLAGQERSNEILTKLCELFENIETKAQAEIERTKEELIERIKQKNRGITIFQPSGGDSRVLFQVLADNISQGQSFKQNPLFSLFSMGNLIKQVSCKNCPKGQPKNFVENSLMINAREDLYFAKASPRNFFQTDSELRHCSICNERTPHSKEITLESLPKILALRIEDCSSDISPTIKPRKNLEFCDNRGRKKNYKFFGGVYNTKKGFDGVHSIAYIQETQNGMVKFYNDFMVRSVSWEDIHGYAKLLFYFEENP